MKVGPESEKVIESKSSTRTVSVKFDVFNEQIVVASLFKDKSVRDKFCRVLSVNHFVGDRHKVLFKSILKFNELELEFDIDTFMSLLGDNAEQAGGVEYVNKLISMFDSNVNIDFHIKKLFDDSVRVNFIKNLVPKINNRASDFSSPLSELVGILDDARTSLSGSSNNESNDEFQSHYLSTFNNKDYSRFVSSGDELLDKHLVYGFARTKITIGAARPGMGKTTWLVNTVCKLFRTKKILICPCESGKISFLDNMVCNLSGINKTDLIKNRANLSEKDIKRIEKATNEILESGNVVFYDKIGTDFDSIVMYASGKNFDIIAIDRFEHVIPDLRQETINRYMLRSQSVAKTEFLNVHWLFITQIKRLGDRGKGSKRPTLELLKNSGAFEEVADNVIFLYRPAYYDVDISIDVIEEILAKQRDGEDGVAVYRLFYPEFSRIGEEATGYIPDDGGEF